MVNAVLVHELLLVAGVVRGNVNCLVGVAERLGDVKESQNSPEMLRSLFGKVQPIPFEAALDETVLWLKEFGDSVANGPRAHD